ncbi:MULTISPECIES: nitroreductase/quinone reductase family protein [Streptomyces]|uniref:nitroreductase/quinone reductase family protein n=1 Tax=Streptomyces TaxID=1883 RepID=UPI0006AD491A|nr:MULTISPECIES: nitroreductase/quinone reductase family protein [unclassified Streptomyces]ALC28196.1 deazaflavin-dependent nitroreductase [Streptomyces sp. CFMR 7]MCR8944301.1 nitroreductase family deazaflavin-dependent oxidoreductase [Streptomyces sp. OUCMDZ-4982]
MAPAPSAPTPDRALRLVQKVSSTRAFAKVAPHVVPVLDRTVHRLTRGRVLPSARMLPGLVLTVPGARSGRPRVTPLACMPEGEAESTWILVGSNFGRPGHPAWTANLLARPEEAVISWRGRSIPVRARLLEGAEREEVWRVALAFWPPYAAYQARVERRIRLFRLERR